MRIKNFACALGLAMLPLAAAPAIAAEPVAEAAALPVMAVPTPPKGKGLIVFYRSQSIFGAAISCAVSENGKKLSSMGVGRYFLYAAEPGKHSVSVSSEAKDVLTLEVEADEVQYVGCRIKMGIMAGRPDLFPAKEADFRGNKNLKLADPKTYGEGVLKPEEVAQLLAAPAAAAAAAAAAAPAAPAAQ